MLPKWQPKTPRGLAFSARRNQRENYFTALMRPFSIVTIRDKSDMRPSRRIGPSLRQPNQLLFPHYETCPNVEPFRFLRSTLHKRTSLNPLWFGG